jgi:hypothetical protein
VAQLSQPFGDARLVDEAGVIRADRDAKYLVRHDRTGDFPPSWISTL